MAKEEKQINPQHETKNISQGRGKGWEEAIQHKVLNLHFKDVEKVSEDKIKHEFKIEVKGLKQLGAKANVFADFVVDRGEYYELIECKEWNHPIFNIGPALGQALVYKELIKKTNGYPGNKEKHIKLSLCFVDHFVSQYGRWTPDHDDLLTKLARSTGEELSVYLVAPKESKFSAKEYLKEDKNFHVVQPVKIFK